MEGETLTLTKAGENLFHFDAKRDIPAAKTNRVVGTTDFGCGRLIYETSGYFHLPLDSQSQLIIVRGKPTSFASQEQQ
jgi:acetoacetate decarboxylase